MGQGNQTRTRGISVLLVTFALFIGLPPALSLAGLNTSGTGCGADSISNPWGPTTTWSHPSPTPVGDESNPVGQDSTPVGEESTPVGQDSGPWSPMFTWVPTASTQPVANDPAPGGNPCVPPTGCSNIYPVGDDSTPAGDDSTPVGDNSTPVGDDSTPVGGDSTPVGGDSPPTTAACVPYGCWYIGAWLRHTTVPAASSLPPQPSWPSVLDEDTILCPATAAAQKDVLPSAAQSLRLVVSPIDPRPGDAVSITLAGATPGLTYRISVGSVSKTGLIDAYGAATVTLTLPASQRADVLVLAEVGRVDPTTDTFAIEAQVSLGLGLRVFNLAVTGVEATRLVIAGLALLATGFALTSGRSRRSRPN